MGILGLVSTTVQKGQIKETKNRQVKGVLMAETYVL
jgi:hypothetical protein